MLPTDSNNQYNLNDYDQNDIDNGIDNLVQETPVGWSSICLDQTINYYIDCNIIIAQGKDIEE